MEKSIIQTSKILTSNCTNMSIKDTILIDVIATTCNVTHSTLINTMISGGTLYNSTAIRDIT